MQILPHDSEASSNASILLTTLNAKYIHASLGLRYLRANLGELHDQSAIVEFTIRERPADIAERILALNPTILGFGVYIWNVVETLRVVRILKAVRPEIFIIIGGPEVSYEWEGQEICSFADVVVTGPGDHAFREICQRVLSNNRSSIPKIWAAELPSLHNIQCPYDEYTTKDLAHRLIYVEASRGCAFKCEFCLSSLDKTAWPFPLDKFLEDLGQLRARGAQHFKFVDRTFNLKVDASIRVLDTLLGWMESAEDSAHLFAHFEVIPDHLPEPLLERLSKFPPGSLQLEIGLQTFDPAVQNRISRRQNDVKALANIERLLRETHAHIHCDLIFGLPGETLEGFAAGFNRLVAVQPQEIQLGILKRLRGAPIARHTEEFKLIFDVEPPYAILSTSTVDFVTVQRISRFARYWDLIANSGRFIDTRPLLLGDTPFERFLVFSDYIYETTGRTHELTYETLVDLAFDWLTQQRDIHSSIARDALAADYARIGAKGFPKCLEGRVDRRAKPRTPKTDAVFSERQNRARKSQTDSQQSTD